jgi:exonuclease III
MACSNFLMLIWNVRGLNAPVRRSVVREMTRDIKATVVCLQETKLQQINELMVSEMLGARFKNNFSSLPALGTCRGILIAASDDHFMLQSSSRTRNTLSVRIQMLDDATEWTLTGVYVPQLEVDKTTFLDELNAMQHGIQGEWLVCGDFNLIYKAEDKNNSRLNKRLMGRIKSVLDNLELATMVVS